ncbi:MAG: excinuclease ABC subunit UvrB [Bacilli bacterium]
MFELKSNYSPAGDQKKAIKELVYGINSNKKEQVLLGATGTGKTYTIAQVINEVKMPTLVIAHNKTLAGQLYNEFRELFPNNRVEYFVSYYDYYQPEAYVVRSDTYIEKDASINEEIDELRHSTTASLISNDDVIVVASVSCIYGIGEREEYEKKTLTLREGVTINRDEVISKLVDMQYTKNNIDFKRGTFRVRGDILEIIPIYEKANSIKIEFFGDEIEKIKEVEVVSGKVIKTKKVITIFPASHFVTSEDKLKRAITTIKSELEERLKYFRENGKLLEAERIEQRTNYDLEMLNEVGSVSGIENYSRHLSGKEEGEPPETLIDFFNKPFLTVIDESHVTLPQLRAMYQGDHSRKESLVDYGFRLPSAMDNRPLTFEEFNKKLDKVIYVSATPSPYEIKQANNVVVEQIIRPTGLVDPVIKVFNPTNQIDRVIELINEQINKGNRTLITTLTIRMAEELTKYLEDIGIKVAYLHSEVKTLERMHIVRNLRLGKFDVLVGINLLREGLDLPEVGLVCILDADKEGFLRSKTSLIQTIGRAARNKDGMVVMFASKITEGMKYAIDETNRRRAIQELYNEKNNIIPKTIEKGIPESLVAEEEITKENKLPKITKKQKEKIMKNVEYEMKKAAEQLDFERAAELRDILFELQTEK